MKRSFYRNTARQSAKDWQEGLEIIKANKAELNEFGLIMTAYEPRASRARGE